MNKMDKGKHNLYHYTKDSNTMIRKVKLMKID